MNFEQRCTIAVPREALWDLIMDVPRVASCVPGITGVQRAEGDAYRGRMNFQVGPIRLALEGQVVVETQDRERWQAVMRSEATDHKMGGGVRALMAMSLEERGRQETELVITTNATFLGKLGEFGQPIIRRKADAVLQEFARNLQQRLAVDGA